jgi:predicted  nucleic acid-binding Zn-ribbon protein
MRLKIAILPTAKVLVIENGDVEAAKVKALGFVRRDNGAWMRPGGFDINPREFIRSFPKAVVRDTPDEEFIVRVSAPAAAKVDEVPTVPGASPAKSTFIGINRLGHEVHETEDGRHTVDQRGRSTREHSLSIAVPGLFLRATDNASLQECIDGYLTHCLASERYPLPEFQRFLRTISPDGNGLSKQALSDGILSSAEKLLSARDKLSLRDKFSRAISFEAALRGFEPDSINMPLAIAVRRMMGTDLEMLGQSVVADGAGLQLINGLLPRGSRIAAERAAASMSVDFAGGDQKAILSRLSGRGPSARSFVFLAASGPEDNRAVLKSIASSFFIEAVGNLTADAGGPGLLAVIGSRLDVEAPHADPTGRIRDVEGYPDLWSWATDVSISRAKQVEAVKSGIVTDADLTNADPSMLKNNFQVPYASASKAVPSTMVPKELDGPTRQSLDRVVATYGDIDHQVALDFGIPEDDLHGLLAAEQIDFLGIYLTAEQRNRNAVLLADGPGAGKGRPLAAIAKRAVMQGKRVIFLTEREINLGDFHRDVTHIKANDLLRPYVMNEGASLVDEVTGNKFEVGDQAILKRAVSEGVWPEGVEVIYATYSQFNRPASDSARAKWLQSVVSDDVVLLMDECHNAAGNSETSRNMEVAVEKCGFAVFSSGTYSANANMMRFYKKLFPDTISSEEIVAMMGRGGEEFQEVIAAMLVADGVMVRRELDLSKIEFSNVVDSERIGRNHELMDKLALIISEMASLSGELDEWVGDRNRNDETNVKSIQLNRASFGSPLYLMTRMFSAALLSDLASERAIAALKNNEKPVVLVENTVQAILEDFAAKDAGAPDFRAIVHRILNQITSARTVDEDGAAVGDEIDVANEAGQDVAVAKIRRLIDALPVLPASPIDYVRDRIEAEGFTCGEITGRSLTIRNGNVVARTKAERDRIANKNGFNSGKFDALIVNVSGSTGVDMHAGRRFKDKRRRVLVELQGPAHVLRQVQAYFRVCRRDQDSHPRIEMLSSGLPAEARLGAMRNQKLRRLSANVSSNRDNAFLATNIPDLINSVGDIVITRYMEMRPDLVERLHLNDRVTDENEEADRAGTDAAAVVVENAANRFLSRLMLLPASAQEKILSELTSEYEAQIEELEARGINPLRPREMDGVVHIRENKVFEHGSEEGANTVFDSALHMTNVMVERVVDPLRADAVVEAVEAGSAKFSRVINAVSNLTQNREAFIEQYLPKTTRTVDEALARGAARATMVNEAISMLIEVLPQLVPGRALNLPFIENTGTAVITSVSTPKPGFEHIPSLYWVDIASPGATTIAHYNLSGILQAKEVMTKDEDGTYSVSVKEGLEGSDYDQVLDEFENAVAKKMTPAVLLTSNVFKAVRLATQHKLGRLVSFVDSNGVRNRGVLVNKAAEKSLNLISLRIDNINAAITILSDMRGELTTAPGSPDRAILVTPLSESQWMIRIPEWRRKRNGEVTWPNEDYKGLYDAGEKDSKSRSRLMITSEDDLKSALETIFDTGLFSFYASSKYRSQFKLPEAAGSGMSI